MVLLLSYGAEVNIKDLVCKYNYDELTNIDE